MCSTAMLQPLSLCSLRDSYYRSMQRNSYMPRHDDYGILEEATLINDFILVTAINPIVLTFKLLLEITDGLFAYLKSGKSLERADPDPTKIHFSCSLTLEFNHSKPKQFQ